jgi:mannose-6-phosphate isomerase
VDGDRPEDWIASVVTAVNPGLPAQADEGLTPVTDPSGQGTTIARLLAEQPEAMLGAGHLARQGAQLGFLAKLLDAGMRLHVQAHPTRDFARRRLGSPFGKLEAYVILAVRPGTTGWIRLGFQRSPGRDGWRDIVARQDTPAMDACFAEIPVQVGETWLVPGGWPHAIGPGVLMLEVMEPSDLVVRCEFEREGIVVPPAGRFMGRDLEFCLDVFDYTERSVAEVRAACCLAERTAFAPGLRELLGPAHTDCFRIARLQVPARGAAVLPRRGGVALLLGETGSATLAAGDQHLTLAPLAAALIPAASSEVVIRAGDENLSLVVVEP